jgi:hypothetical protein
LIVFDAEQMRVIVTPIEQKKTKIALHSGQLDAVLVACDS